MNEDSMSSYYGDAELDAWDGNVEDELTALRAEVEQLRAELEAMHRLYDHFKTENEHDAWDVLDVWFQSNAPMK